jgi:hypothetical protein
MFAPGSYRARGHDHNPMPCCMLLRALADKLNNVSPVEAREPPVSTLVPSFTTSVWLPLIVISAV